MFKFVGKVFVSYYIIFVPGYEYYKYYIRQPYDLSERYGDKSWVVITGASDGLGKEFAKQFAQKGFNLFLISRTESKLKDVSDSCKEYNVETKYMVKDFTKSYQTDFFDDIMKETEELDVSVLVNNVGVGGSGPLESYKKEKLYDFISVNLMPQTILSYKFLSRMVKREKKSSVINLSSIAGTQPFATSPVYSSTKVYNDHFSRA